MRNECLLSYLSTFKEKRSRSKKIKCHIQKFNTLENNNVPYSHYKIIPMNAIETSVLSFHLFIFIPFHESSSCIMFITLEKINLRSNEWICLQWWYTNLKQNPETFKNTKKSQVLRRICAPRAYTSTENHTFMSHDHQWNSKTAVTQ